uniref:Uncharacterized protein n=1 Tax=Panagrolaimus sp. JU765 TaxID=591449 RepID=A0AC34RLG6_9BILA
MPKKYDPFQDLLRAIIILLNLKPKDDNAMRTYYVGLLQIFGYGEFEKIEFSSGRGLDGSYFFLLCKEFFVLSENKMKFFFEIPMTMEEILEEILVLKSDVKIPPRLAQLKILLSTVIHICQTKIMLPEDPFKNYINFLRELILSFPGHSIESLENAIHLMKTGSWKNSDCFFLTMDYEPKKDHNWPKYIYFSGGKEAVFFDHFAQIKHFLTSNVETFDDFVERNGIELFKKMSTTLPVTTTLSPLVCKTRDDLTSNTNSDAVPGSSTSPVQSWTDPEYFYAEPSNPAPQPSSSTVGTSNVITGGPVQQPPQLYVNPDRDPDLNKSLNDFNLVAEKVKQQYEHENPTTDPSSPKPGPSTVMTGGPGVPQTHAPTSEVPKPVSF